MLILSMLLGKINVIIIFNGDILIYVRLDLKNKVAILFIEMFFFFYRKCIILINTKIQMCRTIHTKRLKLMVSFGFCLCYFFS